jgi:plastocyanin
MTIAAGFVAAACGYSGDSTIGRTTGPGSSDSNATATSIVAAEGDGQSAPAGSPLPDPLVVRVRDAGGGRIEGVRVRWAVTDGGGTLGSDTSLTDSRGEASNRLTLGDSIGVQTVMATVESDTTLQATFNASATPVPLNVSVTVRDTAFAPVEATVRAGGVVTWTWTGTLEHDITWISASFPEADDRSTGTHQVTFPSAGTFGYYCSIHGTPTTGMRGSVKVID